MKNLLRTLLFLALLGPAIGAAPAQDPVQEFGWDCPGTGYLPFHRELLVSTERLAALIEEGSVTIVHVGFEEIESRSLRRVRYEDGHLPGALHLTWSELAGLSCEPAALGSHLDVFRELGLPAEGRIVFYDTGVGREAAAAFAALNALGLADRAALLDGQWSKWAFEGRPLNRFRTVIPPSELESHSAEVAVTELPESSFLVDARPACARTQNRRKDAKARISWEMNLASLACPVLRDETGLRRLWASVPPRAEATVVVGSRCWKEAAPVYFAAKLLGYSARILNGTIEQENEGFEPDLEGGP